MINANKSHLEINGSTLDIIFELNSIFDMLIHDHPELLIGVMSAWDNTLLDVTFNLTAKQKISLNAVADMSKNYINLMQKEDNKDDE